METCLSTSVSILSIQGKRPHLLSCQLPKPFLQLNGRRRPKFLLNQPTSVYLSSGTYKGPISAEKQGWDLGRFFRTLYFFNGPPSPAKILEFVIAKLSGPSPEESEKKMEASGYVLVVGATGGVGRRVVNNLRKKGFPVKALVRNEEKARKMLGPDIELILGDITKESTLAAEYFKGVRTVINAASVIIGPKEGDSPDRAKYSQGVKFFEPEIKGDSPEMVEYIGMKNLINAVQESVGLRTGKLLFGFEDQMSKELDWGALDDVVMGGVSESMFQVDPTGGESGKPTGLFKGVVSTANNGGFTSIRTKNFSSPVDLSAYDGLELRLKGDGRRYKLIVRTSSDWDTVGYTGSFDTIGGQWQSIRLPFSSLRPVFRARTVADAPTFDPSNVVSFQLMFSKFEYDGKLNPTFVEGSFELPLSSIKAYIKDPITPRFVHVSSAGVTRPDRPGIDLSKQPPAVRLNKELGFVLTFKLKNFMVTNIMGELHCFECCESFGCCCVIHSWNFERARCPHKPIAVPDNHPYTTRFRSIIKTGIKIYLFSSLSWSNPVNSAIIGQSSSLIYLLLLGCVVFFKIHLSLCRKPYVRVSNSLVCLCVSSCPNDPNCSQQELESLIIEFSVGLFQPQNWILRIILYY